MNPRRPTPPPPFPDRFSRTYTSSPTRRSPFPVLTRDRSVNIETVCRISCHISKHPLTLEDSYEVVEKADDCSVFHRCWSRGLSILGQCSSASKRLSSNRRQSWPSVSRRRRHCIGGRRENGRTRKGMGELNTEMGGCSTIGGRGAEGVPSGLAGEIIRQERAEADRRDPA